MNLWVCRKTLCVSFYEGERVSLFVYVRVCVWLLLSLSNIYDFAVLFIVCTAGILISSVNWATLKAGVKVRGKKGKRKLTTSRQMRLERHILHFAFSSEIWVLFKSEALLEDCVSSSNHLLEKHPLLYTKCRESVIPFLCWSCLRAL